MSMNNTFKGILNDVTKVTQQTELEQESELFLLWCLHPETFSHSFQYSGKVLCSSEMG